MPLLSSAHVNHQEPQHSRTVGSVAPLKLRALLGEHGWFRLPAAVRDRFQAGHADTVYEGKMTMLDCSWIGRCFAALSRIVGAPLTAMRAESVPALVRVSNNGIGGVIWERRFQVAGGPETSVRSTKELGPDGLLFERTDGGLGMSLAVFEEDGALVFESRRYELVLGGRHLVIPALLTPGVCRVTHLDLGAGSFRFTLTMNHPLWGRTFHQSGDFVDPPACDGNDA
ncbi:MAG: DUF4166 domain-containing protein [Rhizobacter sp.]